VLFFLGMIALLITGVVVIAIGAKHGRGSQLFVGLGIVVLGPLVLRIYAEVLIVVFRINETLTDLRALAIWTAEREHGFDKEALGEDTGSMPAVTEN
jgi:Domain of unknown function (DUF4282)